MKNLLLIFFLLTLQAQAQKETLHTLDAEGITSIVLSADEIFKITLTTAPVNQISIRVHSDGEYFNQISLDEEVRGETLYLTSRFREVLQSGYDKLSAHKVFAMEIVLEIPEGLSVDISSNLASVHASGDYKSLLVQLRSGSCYLSGFTGDAKVNTFNGTIEVTTRNTQIKALSRHGEVVLPQNNTGTHKMELSSINGDIRVQKTK